MKQPKPAPWNPDWTTVPEASVNYLLEEAKEYLKGTIELGINADQRSAALCGVFGGGAFALFAVSATVFAGDHANNIFQLAAIIAGFILMIASLLCASAASPGDFYVSGYEPRQLFSSAGDTLWMQRYTIEDIQIRIEANRAEIDREASLIKWAVRVAKGGMAIGVLIFLAGFFLNSSQTQTIHPSSEASLAEGEVAVMAKVEPPVMVGAKVPASVQLPSCVLLNIGQLSASIGDIQGNCDVSIHVSGALKGATN
jgi:hypothetical protein